MCGQPMDAPVPVPASYVPRVVSANPLAAPPRAPLSTRLRTRLEPLLERLPGHMLLELHAEGGGTLH